MRFSLANDVECPGFVKLGTPAERLTVLALIGLIIACVGQQASASINILTLIDKNWDVLGQFSSDASDPDVDEVAILSNMPSLGGTTGARIDLAADARLFAVLDNRTVIHEIDPETGWHLDSFDVGVPLEGLAALPDGRLFVNWEHIGILDVDFDSKTSSIATTYSDPIDIDGIDFDGTGNLIGSDLNESGTLYDIPLDGSAIQTVGVFPSIPAGDVSYSAAENAFFFFSQISQDLHRLPWADGAASDDLMFVKTINANGRAMGIATVPEPSTALLMLIGGLCVLPRRK